MAQDLTISQACGPTAARGFRSGLSSGCRTGGATGKARPSLFIRVAAARRSFGGESELLGSWTGGKDLYCTEQIGVRAGDGTAPMCGYASPRPCHQSCGSATIGPAFYGVAPALQFRTSFSFWGFCPKIPGGFRGHAINTARPMGRRSTQPGGMHGFGQSGAIENMRTINESHQSTVESAHRSIEGQVWLCNDYGFGQGRRRHSEAHRQTAREGQQLLAEPSDSSLKSRQWSNGVERRQQGQRPRLSEPNLRESHVDGNAARQLPRSYNSSR